MRSKLRIDIPTIDTPKDVNAPLQWVFPALIRPPSISANNDRLTLAPTVVVAQTFGGYFIPEDGHVPAAGASSETILR